MRFTAFCLCEHVFLLIFILHLALSLLFSKWKRALYSTELCELNKSPYTASNSSVVVWFSILAFSLALCILSPLLATRTFRCTRITLTAIARRRRTENPLCILCRFIWFNAGCCIYVRKLYFTESVASFGLFIFSFSRARTLLLAMIIFGLYNKLIWKVHLIWHKCEHWHCDAPRSQNNNMLAISISLSVYPYCSFAKWQNCFFYRF